SYYDRSSVKRDNYLAPKLGSILLCQVVRELIAQFLEDDPHLVFYTTPVIVTLGRMVAKFI
ncbi:MAG: hypothetical protein AAFX46_16525, partial [Cyanobacteria bacterium J06636_27]